MPGRSENGRFFLDWRFIIAVLTAVGVGAGGGQLSAIGGDSARVEVLEVRVQHLAVHQEKEHEEVYEQLIDINDKLDELFLILAGR